MSRRLAAAVAVVATCIPLVFSGPAIGLSPAVPSTQEVDARRGEVRPTLEQQTIVSQLGANVTWNNFGTPHSLIRYGGYLATGLQGSSAADAARNWVQSNRALFRLSSASSLRLLNEARLPDSDGYAVLFGQEFDGLRAAEGGRLTVGVAGSPATGWSVAYASSTLVGDSSVSGDRTLSAEEAWARAAADVGFAVPAPDIQALARDREWSTFRVQGLEHRQLARLVAVPTPLDGVRPAYETIVLDPDNATVFAHFIDAETGAVLVRRSLVHYQAAPEPKWETFPAYPRLGNQTFPWNYPSTDIRETWCWSPAPGCDLVVANNANAADQSIPWDVKPPTNVPTNTTEGNNARTGESWSSPFTPGPSGFKPTSLTRNYIFPWTNAWHVNQPKPQFPKGCATENLQPGTGNDISAAVVNLFVGHNRMHDWTYYLGFTEATWNAQDHNFGVNTPGEKDPLVGDVQAGAAQGSPSYVGRDNANMATVPDGQSSITNMYLWQPVAGAAYVPCVDGDFDMAVIGHEFGHMVENRMIAKGGTRAGHHAGAMGESYGDLMAMEYLNEYGFVPVSNENRYAVGAYATGNFEKGVRNYAMNYARTGAFPTPGSNPRINPLNFSDMGYDIVEQQVHANGEIWSAVNFDIRRAMIAKYGAGTAQRQKRCADGELPANQCPGNRRWIQIMFDAFLLMPDNAPSMLVARDAYLAADQLRFGGANQKLLWFAFARRGFGEKAFSTNNSPERQANSDTDPTPSFESPQHGEGVLRFRATAAAEGGAPINARIFVGHYEARVSPIADTNSTTNAPSNPPEGQEDRGNNLDNVARFVPGTYEFIAQADGYGLHRFRLSVGAGDNRTVTIRFPTNWASRFKGATAVGEGQRHQDLIDDTESTTWDRTLREPEVSGAFVIIDLAGTAARLVDRVKVSTLLRTDYPAPTVTQTQNRFTALRQFRIQRCRASGVNDCADPEDFTTIFTSGNNAFPGFIFRPVAPEMILREFDVPNTRATHLRIIVLDNQCTGDPDAHGDQDNDPTSGSDCRTGSPGEGPIEVPGDPPQPVARRDNEVHIAEVEVFSGLAAVDGGGKRGGGDNGDDGDDD